LEGDETEREFGAFPEALRWGRGITVPAGRVHDPGRPTLCKGVRVDEDVGFDALYRSTGPRLWRAILAYTGGRRELADDVVAETFTRALERSGSIRSLEPYLYRVAFRLAAQELRRTPTVADVPDRAVEDPELSTLFDALRNLSPGQRAAVYLHYEAISRRVSRRSAGGESAVVA
jgi:hypothetical protein